MPPTQPGPAPSSPRVLLLAAAVPALLAVALLALAVGVVVEALRGDRSSVSNAALLALLLLVWVAGLGMGARGLSLHRRWARAPVVLSELLLLAAAVPLAQGSGAQWAGYVVVALCVLGLLAVLSPPVTATLRD